MIVKPKQWEKKDKALERMKEELGSRFQMWMEDI